MALFRSATKIILFSHNLQPIFIRTEASACLKEILEFKIGEARKNIIAFRKAHGNDVVGKVTLNMMYGGMRGILGIVWEPSYLDPHEGIRFGGMTIPEIQKKLPQFECGKQPLPEAMFWLLITGDIPTRDQVDMVSREWAEKATLPPHIVKMMKDFPKELHPMCQFTMAVTALSQYSKFRKAFDKGHPKLKLWEPAFDDAMDLCAKVIVIAANIYNNVYRNKTTDIKVVDLCNDWSLNYTNLVGYNNPDFTELMRLYFTIHCDHEGGNVSAHACHLVGSALSDPYLSLGAGLSGLAGPLHGLANQEVLLFIRQLMKEVGDKPTDEQIKSFVQKTLKSGRVIPGYGHAVLRITDPRFTCQREFALEYLPDFPMFKIVSQLFKIVPGVLKSLGKVQNPWPNVDAHSGVLLQYYGMKEMTYYTVLFGVSRTLGVLSQYVWSRALLLPIERPKTMTTKGLMKMLKFDPCKV